MARPQLKAEFDELPVPEQISLLQELWDRVAARPEGVPVPPSHLAEVRRRAAEHADAPDHVVDWDELAAELRPR